MKILGISAFYHDSAATLLKDGEIIAAAQEERFSRKKHNPRFPYGAIQYCLEEAETEPEELNAIIFYDNPILTLDRTIKTLISAGSKAKSIWLRLFAPNFPGPAFISKIIREKLIL